MLYLISDHAWQRMALRRVRFKELVYILTYGTQFDCAGGVWFVLHQRDIPKVDRRNEAVLKLQTVVVLTDRDVVKTVYRRNDPRRHILTKERYDASAQRSRLNPRVELMAS